MPTLFARDQLRVRGIWANVVDKLVCLTYTQIADHKGYNAMPKANPLDPPIPTVEDEPVPATVMSWWKLTSAVFVGSFMASGLVLFFALAGIDKKLSLIFESVVKIQSNTSH